METDKERAIFNRSCEGWDRSSEYNRIFLRSQENYFNDLLNCRGHVFLNEIYDALGLPRTKTGQLVGWYQGGNAIDFWGSRKR